jgi:hypothetical protein
VTASNKILDRAEILFTKPQTQSLALSRIHSERDEASQARAEKTARLRELRLEKEAELLVAAPVTKHKEKG